MEQEDNIEDNVLLKKFDAKLLKSGHQLGNFPNYYEFNPVNSRLSILESWWSRLAPIISKTNKEGMVSHLDVGYYDRTLVILI